MTATSLLRVPPLFVEQCAGCGRDGIDLCHACRFAFATEAMLVLPGGVLAALPYEGAARRVILALKFRNRRSIARHLGRLMARQLLTHRASSAHAIDVVTWAPTSGTRARRRGYDQAELLARAVAAELGVPCRRLLYRSHGAPQSGRTRQQRLDAPAFRTRPGPSSLCVLVVDDVVTTGATLRAANESLLVAGVGSVVMLAVAATPDRSPAASCRPPADTGGRGGAGRLEPA